MLLRRQPAYKLASTLATSQYRTSISSPTFRAGMATIADWERVTPVSAPPFSVFTKSLQKSAQDDREYRLIRLENGLEAVLVHDSKADKAAASLDVAVGHLHDPVRKHAFFGAFSVLIDHRTICLGLPTFASTCCSWWVHLCVF